MNTERNRSAVFAQFLRAATTSLRRIERRIDEAAAAERANALESIESVAEELEKYSALDPAGDART